MDADKILDRLKKLLRLAESANEHEAAAAAARAAALMTQHQIAAEQLDGGERDPVSEIVIDTLKQNVTWRGILANGIAYAFGASCYWDSGGRLKIVGRNDAIVSTQYMYRYLAAEISRHTEKAWSRKPTRARRSTSTRSWKNAFRVGAATTIADRLRNARDEALRTARSVACNSQSSPGLVRIDQDAHEVVQFMKHLNLRRSGTYSVGDGDGLSAGRDSGLKVNLGAGNARLSPAHKQLGCGS